MIPFIVNSHGSLRLRAFIHTETQDGKSLVEANFAIAMKYVNSFARNYAQNLINPHQLVRALNSNTGLKHNMAELVTIQRAHQSLTSWIELKHDNNA